jgi:hypothetical protein
VQGGGVGQVNGGLGTYVQHAAGPLHTGSGNQVNGGSDRR